MDSPSPHEACLRLADDLEQHWSTDEDLNRSQRQLIANLRSACENGSDDTSNVWALMPALAHHTWEVLRNDQPAELKNALLSTLADATREVPFWRPLFGLATRPDYTATMKQRQWFNPPDSILEVARRIIAGIIKVQSSPPMRSALRIIANCCADNNVNRSIIINRDGIEDLLEEVLGKRRECDLVIPVLYNVCIDYDEPALDANRRPWPAIPQTQVLGDKDDSGTTLSAAEQRLGYCYSLYEDKTSFEILLDAWDQAESCAGTIADLIEIGSRVAFFGADNFVQQNDGRDPDEIAYIDTTPAIIRLLLTKGIKLAQVDTDCRISMCQALLNLLSQAEVQTIVISTEGYLWSLIHLPYTEDYDDLPEEEKQSLQVYQKAFHKLVYDLSATDAYAQNMTDQISSMNINAHNYTDKLSLMENCFKSLSSRARDIPLPLLPPRLQASLYVLIGNSITTKERALSLIRSTTIISHLRQLFLRVSDPEILLPAIGVATRLAMCLVGQQNLGMLLPDLTRLLRAEATNEVDTIATEIRRNACVLMRLLIKGNTDSLHHLIKQPMRSPTPLNPHDPRDPRPMEAVLSLFSSTKDGQTKLEIGRLSIEVLRLLATLKTGGHVTALPGSLEETLKMIFGAQMPPSKVSVADTITYILAQQKLQNASPSQSAQSDLQLEGEAWFGLGLLSAYPSAHASIRAALARDAYRVLNRLREIVTQSSTPASIPPQITSTHDDTNDVAATASQEMISSEPKEQRKDPRYENIKVLVVRMMQPQPSVDSQLEALRFNESPSFGSYAATLEAERKVQEGLEAAAADMGLDWVIV